MNVIKQIFWRNTPLSIQRMVARKLGGFRVRERFNVTDRPWYAYGLLSAADQAAKLGYSEMTAVEFGVANGRGLRVMEKLATEVTNLTGVTIHLVGFDTGDGMPIITDYRDHPEKYRNGDFPMLDQKALRRDVKNVELVIGNIEETVPTYLSRLNRDRPLGFFAMDVDIYSSSKAGLGLFETEPENYLPFVYAYFDDSSSRSHFNRFCGELLSIDEFNDEHKMRKIDIDRGAWNAHREIGPQLWYERMYILHVFDHPKRFPLAERRAKVLPS